MFISDQGTVVVLACDENSKVGRERAKKRRKSYCKELQKSEKIDPIKTGRGKKEKEYVYIFCVSVRWCLFIQ